MPSYAVCFNFADGDVSRSGKYLTCLNGVMDASEYHSTLYIYECPATDSIDHNNADGTSAICPGGWTNYPILVNLIEQDSSGSPQSFDITQLDPGLMAAYLGAGFFIMLPLWAGCWGVQQLLKLVRSV